MADTGRSSLRDAIAAAEKRTFMPQAFTAPKLAATAAELAKTWGAVDQVPPAVMIDEVIAAFRHAFAERRYEILETRQWRLLPFALWHGDPPLAANPTLLAVYEQRLRDRRSRRDIKTLIGAYLRDFASERPGFVRLAALLAELVPTIDWPRRERQRRHKLFDPVQAPGRVADHCLAHGGGPTAGLDDLGLLALMDQGLPLAALRGAIDGLGDHLALHGDIEEGQLSTVLNWALAREGGLPPTVRAPLAHALLLPWADFRQQPSADLLQRLRQFLLHQYADPRVRPKRWLGVNDDAKAVFKRWLVDVAIEQFLEVIDRITVDQTEKRQWRYRKAFWIAYLRNNCIQEADVMFREEGFEAARNFYGDEVPCALLTIGTRYVRRNHEVLLMRIGRLIVADWSQNGPCAIWHEHDQTAPTFGKLHYTSSEVDADKARWRKNHQGSERYSWQTAVRDYIADHTGLRLSNGEFKVGERR